MMVAMMVRAGQKTLFHISTNQTAATAIVFVDGWSNTAGGDHGGAVTLTPPTRVLSQESTN
jgi:hypothetical protein